jgi:hypothetical protein
VREREGASSCRCGRLGRCQDDGIRPCGRTPECARRARRTSRAGATTAHRARSHLAQSRSCPPRGRARAAAWMRARPRHRRWLRPRPQGRTAASSHWALSGAGGGEGVTRGAARPRVRSAALKPGGSDPERARQVLEAVAPPGRRSPHAKRPMQRILFGVPPHPRP